MVALLGTVLAGQPASAAARPTVRLRLSEAEACTLARSLNGRPRRLPALICDPQDLTRTPSVRHPGWFAAFQLIAPDTLGGGSFNRGFYAVNRVTGDAWELVLCTPASSPAVRRARARLRRASRIPPGEWARIARARPCEPA